MMNRAVSQGDGAIRVAPEQDHPRIYLDGLSEVDGEYRAASPGRMRVVAHVFGTLLSLTVIGFGGYWGYKQIMRDVHGVPVVRALEGPIRVAPEDPGGMVASHAGLSVNNVQAMGAASAPEDRLVLAPEPVALSEEDLPAGELAQQPETVELTNQAEADEADLLPDEEVAQSASLTEDLPEDDPIARALALAGAVSAGARPLSDTELTDATDDATEEEGDTDLEPRVAVVAGPGVAISPRPPKRPRATLAVARGPALAPVPTVLEASAVPKGTRMVQLGAFDSAAEARGAWDAIATRFGALMEGKSQVVLEAEAGGRTFWRLRAVGFDDLSDARRFCAALVAERADCIPVVAK